MIDSHAHIFNSNYSNICDVISNIKKSGVSKVILVGFSNETNKEVDTISKQYNDFFYPTYGIHPCDITSDNKETLINEFEMFIKDKKFFAIGECGLDYYYSKKFKDEQIFVFEYLIKKSIQMKLPLIIHSRDSISDTLQILKKYSKYNLKGVMHCYSSSYEMALEFIKIGFLISFAGPITFKNSNSLKDVCSKIDLKNILIETDSPYLSPEPFRGKKNDSSNLKYILEEICKIKNVSFDEANKIITNNTIELFNLDKGWKI